MWYLDKMDYYSAVERNEVMTFAATYTDLEIIILSDVKLERERQVPWYHLYVETKIWHKWIYLETDLREWMYG